ncbi:DegT/DnrJ/EryC1/StrS family aminotransferase, partial [Actinomadura viridis]|uniref:DegT/DnrJ/EryC1/StrS family aminotransferase n=1 Tax=Actinomadura viridis TaxID=58110 RepID=UPI0031F1A5BF
DRGLFGVFVAGESQNARVGELDEEMVYESRVNDVFTLGTTSWRIVEITHDRVNVVPAFGNVEVAEAVILTGALPVFADIDPVTYCLDVSGVEAATTPRTAAVVVVHRFGRPADMGKLIEAGQRRGLLVLQHGESEAPYDEIAQRRQRAAYLDLKLRGVRTPDDGDG